jgi:hypothetical protein
MWEWFTPDGVWPTSVGSLNVQYAWAGSSVYVRVHYTYPDETGGLLTSRPVQIPKISAKLTLKKIARNKIRLTRTIPQGSGFGPQCKIIISWGKKTTKTYKRSCIDDQVTYTFKAPPKAFKRSHNKPIKIRATIKETRRTNHTTTTLKPKLKPPKKK